MGPFKLFQITLKGRNPSAVQVAFPHLQGETECSWVPRQEQVLPPELEEAPQLTVSSPQPIPITGTSQMILFFLAALPCSRRGMRLL